MVILALMLRGGELGGKGDLYKCWIQIVTLYSKNEVKANIQELYWRTSLLIEC